MRPLTLVAVLSIAAAALPNGRPAAELLARVSSVDGNVIHVANGLIAIDARNAEIVWHGSASTIAAVTKGSLIIATLNAASLPATATRINVVRPSDVQLAGPVMAVDAAHGTLMILGLTIAVDAGTRFDPNAKGLAQVKPGQMLSVDANRNGNRLVADAVGVVPLHNVAVDRRHEAAHGARSRLTRGALIR